MAVNAGDLNRPVILRQPVKLVNDEGGTEVSYSEETITTKAYVKEVNQFRGTESKGVTITDSKDFFIRWASNRTIKKDWIVEYEGSKYTIHEIERIDEKYKFIRIRAKISA
jgi:SPP1 family predicted phage head-tail adaptor